MNLFVMAKSILIWVDQSTIEGKFYVLAPCVSIKAGRLDVRLWMGLLISWSYPALGLASRSP